MAVIGTGPAVGMVRGPAQPPVVRSRKKAIKETSRLMRGEMYRAGRRGQTPLAV